MSNEEEQGHMRCDQHRCCEQRPLNWNLPVIRLLPTCHPEQKARRTLLSWRRISSLTFFRELRTRFFATSFLRMTKERACSSLTT